MQNCSSDLFGWRELVRENTNLGGGGYQLSCLIGGYENLGERVL